MSLLKAWRMASRLARRDPNINLYEAHRVLDDFFLSWTAASCFLAAVAVALWMKGWL